MIHITRMLSLIRAGRMFIIVSIAWTIPIVRVITVAGENAAGGGEQGNAG
jgi:hypothetical protein